ncbi:MAG TPA: hypothetical protein VG826_04280 [Pirellulales bacterium]|nr:hypothetical protein [Pirellulales bacterium]
MPDQPSQYVRTTITVPHNLKQRMLQVSGVNWSAVACDAFERKLSESSKRESERAMSEMPQFDDAIERLRRLKNLPPTSENPQDFEAGYQWGRRWAMATATPQELDRLERFCDEARDNWSSGSKEIMKRIALAVTGIELRDRRTEVPAVLRQFWPVRVGLPEKPGDCSTFARGFCDGAVGFWNEAKDKI